MPIKGERRNQDSRKEYWNNYKYINIGNKYSYQEAAMAHKYANQFRPKCPSKLPHL